MSALISLIWALWVVFLMSYLLFTFLNHSRRSYTRPRQPAGFMHILLKDGLELTLPVESDSAHIHATDRLTEALQEPLKPVTLTGVRGSKKVEIIPHEMVGWYWEPRKKARSWLR